VELGSRLALSEEAVEFAASGADMFAPPSTAFSLHRPFWECELADEDRVGRRLARALIKELHA
jgi:hypothetical protein